MKILLVNPFFWPYGGGIEYHIEQLAKHLGKEHDVEIITSRLEEPHNPKEYNVKRLPCIWGNMPLLSPPPLVITPKIFGELKRKAKDADLIHLHTRWYPDYVMAAILAKKSADKPLFFTAHEPARLTVDPLLDIIARGNDLIFTKWLIRNANLFSVSRAVADTFNDTFQKETLRVVYNGVDTKKFNPTLDGELFKESIGLTAPYIMFVGRLVKQKAVKNLIRAFAGAKTNLNLVIIGRGTEEGTLRKEARKLGVLDRIKFVTEFLDEEKLASAYAGCEFFVLPSIWEAFGIVLVEAMACGKCCLGTNAGGIPEVVGDTGLIVPKGDITAMKAAIEKLHSNPKLRRELGKKARKRVLTRFTWKKMTERTFSGYEEIVG